MHATVDARKTADHVKAAPCDELKTYLDVPLEPVSNVIMWWRVCCMSERLKRQLITVKAHMLCSTLFLQLCGETISQFKGLLHCQNVPSQVALSLIQSIVTTSHPPFLKLFKFWRAHIEVVISVPLTRLRCMLRWQWMSWMMIISFTWWYKKNYISFGLVRGSHTSKPEPDLRLHSDKVQFKVWKNGWTKHKSSSAFSQMSLKTRLNWTWASLLHPTNTLWAEALEKTHHNFYAPAHTMSCVPQSLFDKVDAKDKYQYINSHDSCQKC